MSTADPRDALRADCAHCRALCCVLLPFSASADFAFDKRAGRPCVNLTAGHRCGIHDQLPERGFAGCVAYDCFGAGQYVSALPGAHDAAFAEVRRLHELRWYLLEVLELDAARALHPRARELDAEIGAALRGVALAQPHGAPGPADALRSQVGQVLESVSSLVRAPDRAPAGRASTGRGHRRDRHPRGADPHGGDLRGADLRGADLRGADLAGARLAGADLRGADLRGAVLIAAELAGADLRRAALLGADLRGARLAGADASSALFLTRMQLDAARGDACTLLPAALPRPRHW